VEDPLCNGFDFLTGNILGYSWNSDLRFLAKDMPVFVKIVVDVRVDWFIICYDFSR